MEFDLNNTRVFTSVVQARSFTAAAKKLGMPVSTVSRRVHRLEEELGVKLMQRTTRKLSLTDAGELFYDRCVRALAELEEAQNLLSNVRATPRGRLRVTGPAEHRLLMEIVNAFVRLYPEVQVELHFTSRVVNILEEGYDVAIVAGTPATDAVVAHELFASPFAIVASPSYLARRGTPTHHSELIEHDCVLFGTSLTSAHWNLKGARVAVSGPIAANHILAIRDAAIAGHGLAFLPRMACAPALDAGDLVSVLPDACPDPTRVYITYPAGRLLPAAVRAFVNFARDHVRGDA